jgi:hypothetical protein
MKRLILTFFVVLITGCGNGSLLAPNASESAAPGIVSFTVAHHSEEASENDQGFTITLTVAKLGWKEMVLISGGEDPECLEGRDQRIVLNKNEDLLQEDGLPSELSDATVPMIAYCRYRIVFGPSVAPAALIVDGGKAHDTGGGEPQGTAVSDGAEDSFRLSGTWTKDGDSGVFDIHSTLGVAVEGAFRAEEDGIVIDHPLHFHEEESVVGVAFGSHYGALLDGIDFRNDSEETQTSKAAANLATAVRQDGVSHAE